MQRDPHFVAPVDSGKVLIVPDLHWRDSDKKSIKGYVDVSEMIADDIEQIIIEHKITHLIQTGDWTDKGYRNDSFKYSHYNRVSHWKNLLNGNLTMVIGNHFYLERDNNPEMYWIQPHPYERPKTSVYSKEPLVKTPKSFKVGPAEFVLHHFQKDMAENREYLTYPEEGTKYVIGIYHDDVILPASIQSKNVWGASVRSDRLYEHFHNVTHAIFGHIHNPHPPTPIDVGGRKVVFNVIGSAMICARNEVHESVDLPLYTIEDGKVRVEYIKLNLYRDKLRFQKEGETILPSDATVPEDLRGTGDIGGFISRDKEYVTSCEDFMRSHGADEKDIQVYRAASTGKLEFQVVVNNYKGEPTNV